MNRSLPILMLLLLVLTGVTGATGESLDDQGDFVVAWMPAAMSMEVDHRGLATDPARFLRRDALTINGFYFHPGTFCTMGWVRSGGYVRGGDGRPVGIGVAWNGDGSDWRQVPVDQLFRYENGFQAGPTLVLDGGAVDMAEAQGVRPDPYSARERIALARDRKGRTFVVATRRGYTLMGFAHLVQRMGAWEAVNLDGGSSTFLGYRGKAYVSGRPLPGALVLRGVGGSVPSVVPVPSRPQAAPRATGKLASVRLGRPGEVRVVFLDPSRSAVGQVERLEGTVFGPDLFSPGQPDVPLGALLSEGVRRSRHAGPPVGFAFGVTGSTVYVGRCNRSYLGREDLHWGGCGPLLLRDGKVQDLEAQGYRRTGGLFGRARRLALAGSGGALHVVGCTDDLTPEEFCQRLLAEGHRWALALSGGQHALLYSQGRWLVRPSQPVPYVFVAR